jgi:hypothetical protein
MVNGRASVAAITFCHRVDRNGPPVARIDSTGEMVAMASTMVEICRHTPSTAARMKWLRVWW